MAKYLVLSYEDEAPWAAGVEGATATAMRRNGSGGYPVTDGPFVETKEAVRGFYLLEAPDHDRTGRRARSRRPSAASRSVPPWSSTEAAAAAGPSASSLNPSTASYTVSASPVQALAVR